MAKSGQSNVHSPQSEHASPSTTSGGWYPFELVCLDMTNTERGQNSTQKPQPLQRSSMIWRIPCGIRIWSWSNGWRQNFMIAPKLLMRASEELLVSPCSAVGKMPVVHMENETLVRLFFYTTVGYKSHCSFRPHKIQSTDGILLWQPVIISIMLIVSDNPDM